jgi:Polysaccharide pyruvyl transferase
MIKRNRRYYLVCSAAGLNYGDDLIASAWLRFLAEIDPDAEVIVDSVMADVAQTTLAGIHPSARFTDALWMTCFDSPDPNPLAVSAFVAKAVEEPDRIPGRSAQLEELARADVVHLVGGGFLNGLFQWTFGLPAGIIAATRRSGARSAMTGQGLCPEPQQEVLAHLREIARQFTIVDVRDEQSAEVLGSGQVNVSVDDVFLGLNPQMYRPGGVPGVMVCAHTDTTPGLTGRASVPELAEFVIGTLKLWGAEDDDVGFVECFPGLDHKIFDEVRDAMPGIRYFGLYDTLRSGLPAAAGQHWLSTRFHPHLVAAAAGASGIALSVIPEYYDIKHGSLISQGSGWRLHTDLSVPPPKPDDGGFPSDVLRQYAGQKRRLAELVYAPADWRGDPA